MAADRSSEPRPPPAALAAAAAGALLLAVAYPWALAAAEARVGARGVALAMLGLAGLSLALRGPGAGWRRLATAAFAGLVALALATGDGRPMRLVPAAIYVGLAASFAASLRGPGSIIETAARWLVPEAPGFIRGYCRVVTASWVAVFLAIAAAIAWLALAGSPAAWLAATSRDAWIAMIALSAVEFLVRKTWFRYYYRGGPFDRLWSRIFPAERTARGRRSLRAIEEHRARVSDGGAPGR